MFTLKNLRKQESRTVKIDLGDPGEMSVVIRELSLGEELAAEFAASPLAARVHASVVDWSGVCDADGKPVAFTHDAFLAACRQDRRILVQAINAVVGMYGDREASKKS